MCSCVRVNNRERESQTSRGVQLRETMGLAPLDDEGGLGTATNQASAPSLTKPSAAVICRGFFQIGRAESRPGPNVSMVRLNIVDLCILRTGSGMSRATSKAPDLPERKPSQRMSKRTPLIYYPIKCFALSFVAPSSINLHTGYSIQVRIFHVPPFSLFFRS